MQQGAGGLAARSLVAAVCEEGGASRRAAVSFCTWLGHLPILVVVKHLASLRPLGGPSPPPLGVRVSSGNIHVLARTFTAAKTGSMVLMSKVNDPGSESDWNHQTQAEHDASAEALRLTDLTSGAHQTDLM